MRDRHLGFEGIIPLTMKYVFDKVKRVDFLIAYFDACWIGIAILDRCDGELANQLLFLTIHGYDGIILSFLDFASSIKKFQESQILCR
jgi:hypothetical protein